MSATNADHSSKEVSSQVSPPAGGQPGTTTRPVRYAISYARKSSTDDIAVVDQHAFNAKRAAAEGYIIPDDPKFRFSDDISGKHQSRAGLDQLRRWLAKRESPATRVYVRDMSRLSRVSQLTFFPSLVHEFSECGVEMCISTKTPTLCSYDISKSPSALGDFATDMIHGARGAEELQDITLRTTGGTRDRIGHGFFPGRAPFATQRYVADKRTGTFLAQAPVTGTLRFANSAFKLQWDQTLLPWVHHIFDRLEKGASASLVADELNEKMVPTVLANATHLATTPKWSAKSVWAVATNPIYTGTLKWGYRSYPGREGESVATAMRTGQGPLVSQGFIQNPPIDPAQWERVQSALQLRSSKHAPVDLPNRRPYILSGRMRCSTCGASYTGYTGGVRRKVDRKRYYRHGPVPSGYSGKCPHAFRFFRADSIDADVLGLVARVLDSDRMRDVARQEIQRHLSGIGGEDRSKELADLRRRTRELTASLDRATDRIVRSTSTEEAQSFERARTCVLAEMKLVAERVRDLESHEVRAAHLGGKLRDDVDVFGDIRALLGSADPTDQRCLIRAVVASIVLDPSDQHMDIRVRAL